MQISSVINGQFVKTPWRTFEFDSCFRTISPVADGNNNNTKNNQARVKGAYKNVISAERMFVKSYVQLWQSENDLTMRSHLFIELLGYVKIMLLMLSWFGHTWRTFAASSRRQRGRRNPTHDSL